MIKCHFMSFLIVSIGIKEQNGTALIGTNFENLKVSDQSRHLRALHDMLIAILPPPQPCDEAGKCFVQVQPGRLPHRLALPQGKVSKVLFRPAVAPLKLDRNFKRPVTAA